MKIHALTSVAAALCVAALAGCGSQKSVTQPVQRDTVVVTPDTTTRLPAVYAGASTQFLSVREAAIVALHPEQIATVASRYGYKTITGYGVYRLDSYDRMLYRNCTPAKRMGKGVYADLPQPQRKGTSSYVALKGGSVIIGVFNDKAYANLLEQVKGGGLRLVEQGYEDHYTNGSVDVYCYATRRTVRVEKTQQ